MMAVKEEFGRLLGQLRALGIKAIRSGPVFYYILDELEKSQFLPACQLEALRNRNLRAMVRHCYEHVPYYHRLFQEERLTPDDFRTIEDLQQLPLMDKETVRDNFEQLISTKGHRFMDCFAGYTSGSTGNAAKYLRDYYFVNFEYAAAWRFFRMHGQRNQRKIQFSGRLLFPSEKTEPPFWTYNLASNMLVFSSFHLSRKTIHAYVDAIREFNPRIIHGWPSSLYQFARLLEETGLTLDLDLQVVMASSETVFDYQRETIERVLGARLRDWYGQQERVSAIGQCEHGAYHIQDDYSATELLQTGDGLEIVGSHFFNRRMPLLRYRTGDYVIPSDQAHCPCGRSFRIVKGVIGRAGNHYIMTPDGRKISVLNGFLLRIPHIREAQFVQESPTELVINVAPYPGFGESERTMLLERARSHISADMTVRVKELAQIPRSPSGKYQLIMNKIRQN